MHFLVTVAVLVYAPPSGGAVARRVEATEQLVAAARARGAVVIGDALAAAVKAHADGWTAAGELGFFGRASALVSDGRAALARVELARGEAAFAKAEESYRPELWRAGVASEAATAALWRGVALFELGRQAEAQRAWRRAVALEPATQLTEATVRPDVARAFGEALKRRATARLAIDTAAGAIVFVDGQRRGAAAAEVALGEHLVVVRASEMRPAVALVDVPAAQTTMTTTMLTLPLARDEAAAAIESARVSPTDDGVEALRSALGVDAVLVAAVAVDGGALTWSAERRQAGCGTATETSTRTDELVRKLTEAPCEPGRPIAVLQAPAIANPRPPPATSTALAAATRRSRAKVWQRPWFWLAVVGAVGVGVVVAVNVWPRDASYAATLDFHQFSLRLP